MERRSNSKFEVYPLVRIEGNWTIPDEVLLGVWVQIVEEGKDKTLFYDGSVTTPFEWMEFIKRPGTYPILIADKEQKRVVHIFWLKDVFDAGAWVHHCSLGRYCYGAWGAARDYWKTHCASLKLLLGITPENNEKTLKLAQKIWKFTVLGKIPQMCLMADGNRIAGFIGYYEL